MPIFLKYCVTLDNILLVYCDYTLQAHDHVICEQLNVNTQVEPWFRNWYWHLVKSYVFDGIDKLSYLGTEYSFI